ncbi:MAG: oxidase [Sorangiineae bacterium NIC37A_2]|jgi:alkyldihydroxyacetonephosphate synthase|nr:MAG: oxidase [Sorangiineae bacterium NIC37A_2]
MIHDDEALDAWGFQDTRFEVQEDDSVVLTGNRYPLSGLRLPSLLPWFSKKLAVKLSGRNQNPPHYPPNIPASRAPAELLTELSTLLGAEHVSTEDRLRLRHGHGHTASEIWAIRYGEIPRVPDVVVFPKDHDEVAALVPVAQKLNAVLVPYGGGTNVTWALKVRPEEQRTVISVDLRRLSRCLKLSVEDGIAVFEAGIRGRDLEAHLAAHGLTMGHEPDSLEFSTLGGWIATNASGMKKNRYGNIEDLVLDVRAVTTSGEISRPESAPRESLGVPPLRCLLGSEGNLGIITQATIKVHRMPERREYGSLIFPSFDAGFHFLRELTHTGRLPASVRLMDNTQFQFGLALKPKTTGLLHRAKSAAEKLLVTKIKGFDPEKMCVVTLVYEGTSAEVEAEMRTTKRLGQKHGALDAGPSNGERGYQLTFGIAYIRDLTFTLKAIAESFETSVPWSHALDLYYRVKARIEREHAALGLPGKPFFTGRVTQLYHTGVCIYFYLGFYTEGVDDPVHAYELLEYAARDEILAAGGSLSHHHGIGKIRQQFLPRVYSPGALALQRAIKQAVDPTDIFAAGNHAMGDVSSGGGSS